MGTRFFLSRDSKAEVDISRKLVTNTGITNYKVMRTSKAIYKGFVLKISWIVNHVNSLTCFVLTGNVSNVWMTPETMGAAMSVLDYNREREHCAKF